MRQNPRAKKALCWTVAIWAPTFLLVSGRADAPAIGIILFLVIAWFVGACMGLPQ
jgi:hypothetical protein